MGTEEDIERLEKYKDLLKTWRSQGRRPQDHVEREQLRSQINQEKGWVRQEVIEAGCFKTLTLSPPSMIGGLVMQRVDPFEMMLASPYGADLVRVVIDIVDSTIGVLKAPPRTKAIEEEPEIRTEIMRDYAFVAMPMDAGDHSLVDVLDAIKEGASRCGIKAERIDEPQTNDRITDRILESIRRAEFVIADLTNSRPNVYYEAGYAHGLGKIPVYIAKAGTRSEFDVKDYPIIFFHSLKQLKDDLEKRLRGLAASRSAS